MKKTNQNFKILTKKETNQVKGGGWFSDMLTSWYDKYQADQAARAMEEADACPPPEPDFE